MSILQIIILPVKYNVFSEDCPANEVYYKCKSCSAKTCDELNVPLQCTNEEVCEEGCFCIHGYLRNSDGICIPEEQCSK